MIGIVGRILGRYLAKIYGMEIDCLRYMGNIYKISFYNICRIVGM